MQWAKYGKNTLQTTVHSVKKCKGIAPSILSNEMLINEISKKIANNCTISDLENMLEGYPDITLQIKPIIEHREEFKETAIPGDKIVKDIAHDVVIQYFRKNRTTNSSESHIAIFAIEKEATIRKRQAEGISSDNLKKDTINKYANLFGNVDIVIIPRSATKDSEITNCQRNDITELERRHCVSIATFLDHGQTLNIGGLGQNLFDRLAMAGKAPKANKKATNNVYKQYLDNFCTYYSEAPNGELMRTPYPEKLILLHETKALPLIKQSKQMKVAATGCIGSVVYTTRISDKNKLGSHTLALNSRMNDGNVDPSGFVYLEVENKDKMLTNWLERLGCGRLWLETAFHVEEDNENKNSHSQENWNKYAWTSNIPEYKSAIENLESLNNLTLNKFDQQYTKLKYANIFNLQDELLRAREIASGIGDQFYEMKDKNSSDNYHLSRDNLRGGHLAYLEDQFKKEVEKCSNIYLEKDIADRELFHFRDRVLAWSNRIYKNNPEIEQIKSQAFVPPYFKWKNRSDVQIGTDTLKGKIDLSLNKMIYMRTANSNPIVNSSHKQSDKVLLANIYAISSKQVAMHELIIKMNNSVNKEEKQHLNFILNNMANEIQNSEIHTHIPENIDESLTSYIEVNKLLPIVLLLQNNYIEKLLTNNNLNDSSYEEHINKLIELAGDNIDLVNQISVQLERNRVRYCINETYKQSINFNKDTFSKLLNATVDDITSRKSLAVDNNLIANEFNQTFDEYNNACTSSKAVPVMELLLLEKKSKELQFMLDATDPASKYLISAHKKIHQPAQFLQCLELAKGEVKNQYTALHPLLQSVLSLRKDTPSLNLKDETVRGSLDQKFHLFWECFSHACKDIESEKLKNSNLLNNILFESIKDFTLLYQESDEANEWRKEGFFEMENQYESFFSMVPSLGIKGEWNTGTKFTPSLKSIENELSMHHINLHNPMTKAIFQKFMLDRFAYYLNVSALEGEYTLPDPIAIKDFNDLSKQLPNLAGILFLGTAADLYSPSPFWTEFQAKMRHVFEESHTEREIYLPIKSGISGTAEIGVRAGVPCKLHEIKHFVKEQQENNVIPHYIAVPSDGSDIKIVDEISLTGGLTGGRYEKK